MPDAAPLAPPGNHILAIDDELSTLHYYAQLLQPQGYRVSLASSGGEALPLALRDQPDLILLDVGMPDEDGFAVCRRLRAEPRLAQVPVLFVSGLDDDQTLDKIYELGEDHISKPLHAIEFLRRLHDQLQLRQQAHEIDLARAQMNVLKHRLVSPPPVQPDEFRAIITVSPLMRSLFQYLENIAGSNRPVLITGETGTGKELLARALHRLSGRQGELVAVNVAGLDDNLFADTLFGHLKGAYTGADRARPGMIERAAGGTLFLDEIGDLGPQAQVKLLRLLQEREYYALGSDVRKHTDARVIVATHRRLPDLIATGQFRRDLYYRLRTHSVLVPPLRERKCDIPLLFNHFLQEACRSMGRPLPATAPPVYERLGDYDFPGNVRELEAVVYDAVSRLQGDVLGTANLVLYSGDTVVDSEPTPPPLTQPTAATSPAVPALPPTGGDFAIVFDGPFPTLRQVTARLIVQALAHSGNRQAEAARLLGLSRQALNKRLRLSRRAADAAAPDMDADGDDAQA